jgi:hypothetical protein
MHTSHFVLLLTMDSHSSAMEAFLQQFDEEEIVALSGVSSSTLLILWDKYCGAGTPIRRPTYLWWLLVFFKIYPVRRAFRTIHGGAFKSGSTFLRRIYVWQVRIIDDCRCWRCLSILR